MWSERALTTTNWHSFRPFTRVIDVPMKQVLCSVLLATVLSGHSPAVQIREHAGPIQLLTLDGTPLTMTNYAERLGTAIVFLSARSLSTNQHIEQIN